MSTQQETFISHLIELRDRLIRALLALVIVFVCLMPWAGDIYDILAKPMMDTLPAGTNMIATGVVTPFFVPVKVTMMVAFVLCLPWVLYQAWAFIAPGLYAHEKRLALPLVAGSTLLFIAGMAFCYFFVFGMVFKFIAEFAPKSIVPAPDIEQYLSFVMSMFLAFGITFEVPVVVIVLAKAGIVSVAKLREARPYVIVGAFVVAAIVTPPDVVSQLMLAIPMCLLYELGIILANWMAKQAPAAASAEERYVPPSIEDMDKELDRIEAGEGADKR
ncbi:twin-arginine translocase subunit TatC [Thauera sp. SDU_THAU2]|uniref:twin-arginine translocase subunit TatC n=1 Tax=Thauera sp. SDU_THAU2 TaxID=3136633 RepID=UPI00311D54F3